MRRTTGAGKRRPASPLVDASAAALRAARLAAAAASSAAREPWSSSSASASSEIVFGYGDLRRPHSSAATACALIEARSASDS
jgi:hypothetical protein